MQLGRSLTRATFLAIAVTVVPGVIALYLFARSVALQQASDTIVHESVAMLTPYLQDFRRTEESVTALSAALAARFDEAAEPDEVAAFDAETAPDEAGVVRNRRERFDGAHEAGVFIPPGVPLTDDLKRRKWRAMRVITNYGLAALKHVDGVWFDQLDKTSVIFWRRDPNFIYTLPADHDYTQTLWDQLASPRLNPARKPQWTPAILETTVGTWVVSCVAPLDRNGEWEGIVGHDIALSDLIGSFHATQLYDGTQHFLLDRDPNKDGKLGDEGDYILAGPWQPSLEARPGDFRPDLSNEPALWEVLWGGSGKATRRVGAGMSMHASNGELPRVTMQGREYLALVIDLDWLNWRYVSLVPVSATLAPLQGAFAGLAALLGLMALAATLIMRSSVRGQIVEPLRGVIATVNNYGRGELTARTRLQAGDEISQLGRAFDQMADSVEQSMHALQGSESRYRSVVENVREVIFQCDSQMRLQYVSPAWQTLARRPPVGAIGHLLTEYLHPEDVERKLSAFRSMCDGSAQSHLGSYRLVRPGGEVRWVEISLQPVSHTDSGCVCIGSIDDISDRLQAQKNMLRLQAQLRQAQKMEALGRLTGGVAHDYNNILAIMLGYTEMAMEQQGDGPIRSMLERVQQAGERGRDLVSKMLTFSRRKVGVPVPTDATAVIDEASAMLRATIPPNIVIATEVDAAAGNVMVDPTGLHQIIMNLVINARDALPDGGQVTVRLKAEADCEGTCTACHADFRGRFVTVEVEDDGSGIPADLLPNIFDPFFTTKEFGRGTGMGLSVVHGIVHESNGHIVVDSRDGDGTTMRLLLPAPPADATVAPDEAAPATSSMQRHGARVLIVDDEAELTKLWERALTRHGYQVEAYVDALVAVDAFRADPSRYDVVILDQAMPGKSGAAFAREILAARPSMPIILCTGYSDSIDAASATSIGIARFMMKPISIATMLSTLNELLAAGAAAGRGERGATSPGAGALRN